MPTPAPCPRWAVATSARPPEEPIGARMAPASRPKPCDTAQEPAPPTRPKPVLASAGSPTDVHHTPPPAAGFLVTATVQILDGPPANYGITHSAEPAGWAWATFCTRGPTHGYLLGCRRPRHPLTPPARVSGLDDRTEFTIPAHGPTRRPTPDTRGAGTPQPHKLSGNPCQR